MKTYAGNIASIAEANQNFSHVAHMVDKNGTAILLEDNAPKYVVIEYREYENLIKCKNIHVEAVAKQVLTENMDAFKELAK